MVWAEKEGRISLLLRKNYECIDVLFRLAEHSGIKPCPVALQDRNGRSASRSPILRRRLIENRPASPNGAGLREGMGRRRKIIAHLHLVTPNQIKPKLNQKQNRS
jgi:hypothetical protein